MRKLAYIVIVMPIMIIINAPGWLYARATGRHHEWIGGPQ